MMEELEEHSYNMSPGTLYPVLHNLESAGVLEREDRLVDKKIRKYYKITASAEEVLNEAIGKAYELFK